MYKSGVYTESSDCGRRLNHAVLATGIGNQSGKAYYNVKNSWGTTWGDRGYIKMAIGTTSRGTCGIANSWDAVPVL